MSRRRSRLPLPPIAIAAAILAAASSTMGGGPAASLPANADGKGAAAKAAARAATPIEDAASIEIRRLDAEALAPATDVRVAPSSKGALGAWLVAGPFRAAKPALDAAPSGVDEGALGASLGAVLGGERDLGGGTGKKKLPPARWTLASSSEGAIDLKATLDASGATGTDLVAYAAGSLHVAHAGHYLLLLGVDDGVRLTVDGRVAFSRDDGRPVREDDDVVPLDLAEGDHDVVLKLHQRDGAWAFRTRFVDATLAPLPGSYLRLPGTTNDDARALAGKMSWVSLDRAFDAAADPPVYRPKLTVRFLEGAPRGVPLAVTSRLVSADRTFFDVQAGGVPVTSSGAGEIVVTLPTVAPFQGAASLETSVAGRVVKSAFPARTSSEQALTRATRALAKAPEDAPWLASGSRDSVAYLTKRLAGLVAKGDGDTEAQADEARELDRLATALEKNVDPYEGRTGPMRRAIRSRLDGEPTEFGLYVPPWYKPGSARKFPLVVGLHGLNGYALGIMRWMWGGDDPKKEQSWEDRHLGSLDGVDAFVITPQAHGNTLYRELGEDDVMQIIDWAMKTFPIDDTRVTITGPSMGGIGAAAIPFHHPHVFAGAMPLCGYHSYLIRSDVAGRPIRPWERFLAEERSNVLWAENGEHLPLYIVHGTRDLPEENSGVLIDRYEKLSFSVKHEHPDAGHNVWQQTYENLEGMKWLLRRRLDPHPAHVRFKTTRPRWGKSAWVTVDELAKEQAWADVDARARGKTKAELTTSGVSALTLARDEKRFDASAPIDVTIDGQSVSFGEAEPLALHREGSTWKKGHAEHAGVWKHGAVAGPIRDVFYEPILFVYAAGPEARANETVARSFAKIRYGVQIAYPVMSDAEFLAQGEPLANDRALFLVGRGNELLAALDKIAPMPIHVEAGAVTMGREGPTQTRFTGKELGAAFIHPNPARPDRYVVVVAGADVPGTLRALSLPDLVPDFVVWDEGLAPSRGQVLLGAGSVRAGGFFTTEWALPATVADPLAKVTRPAAKDEKDATPYLP